MLCTPQSLCAAKIQIFLFRLKSQYASEDNRPESYRVINTEGIKLLEKIGTEREWAERRKLILEKNKIYTNLEELIDLAHANTLSLAIFKPTKITDILAKAADSDWDPEKVEVIMNSFKQGNLFENQDPEDLKIMPKLPYKFSYQFEDDKGISSKLMIEDWEIGQLYWNCVKGSTAEKAVQKVKEKYLEFAKNKELYLFLGTTRQWHGIAPNPFIIVGTFYPPYITQPEFLLTGLRDR